MSYKAVISNPPYSLKWSADKSLAIGNFDLAPKSKADFQFILEGLSRLDEDGTAVYVLPHGVLFRGAAEGKIRKQLLLGKHIEAVIGLPEKLFDVTSIPVMLLVLKRKRDNSDVFFIDASREFEKGKNKNFLIKEHIDKIVDTYLNRKEIDKYSHMATLKEIEDNDFNLNIPRYVDTFEEEEPIDISQVIDEMREIDKQLEENNNELADMVNDLVSTCADGHDELEKLKGYFNDIRTNTGTNRSIAN